MTRPVVVGIGELLWDCFADTRRPGGAPANLAFHAHQVGAEGVTVSRVGDDETGRDLIDFIRDQGLDPSFVQVDPDHATGTVQVETSSTGQPTYHIEPNVAWDWIEVDDALRSLMDRAGAVCFGTLAQRRDRSRATIHELLDRARERGALVVYDVNLRQSFYTPDRIRRSLTAADVVKLNEAEVRVVAALLERAPIQELEFARLLLDEYGVRTVCITRGEHGCAVVDADGAHAIAGVSVEVADTVGAGDAFTAAFVYGALLGHPSAHAAGFANAVGALVASRPGAMPEFAREFDALKQQHLVGTGD